MASPQVTQLSCSTSNASAAFSPSVVKVKIKNIGAVDVYFNINAAATTSLFPIGPNEEIEIGLASSGLTGAIASVQGITASSTSTLQIIGVESWS